MDFDRTTMLGGAAATAFSDEQCAACETTIPAGEEFCPKCGYQRGTWQGDGQSVSATASSAQTPAASSHDGPVLWTLSANGQSWPLAAGTHVLGRGEVDIRLDDGFASRRHAQLEVTADGVKLSDLGSSNGTFVGERRLDANAPEPLIDGGSFKIANTMLSITQAESTSDSTGVTPSGQETAQPEGTQVMDTESNAGMQTDSEGTAIDPDSQVEPGKESQTSSKPSESHWELRREGGETITIGFGEVTLGRKSDATQVIEGDSYVSGVHCRLIATEVRLEVTDLRSTNGTFVNDARLDPEQPWKLASGDTLRVGQTTFSVVNNKLTEGQELEEEEPTG